MNNNVSPISLLHLLNRRRISFERWCAQEEIQNQLQFQEVVNRIEQAGEFFVPQEMRDMAVSLPSGINPTPTLTEPEISKQISKPTKKTKTQSDS